MKGYSFLEIMISLGLLSFGLLGFMQAQIIALHNHQTAYLQSIAQTRLTSLADIVQACEITGCSSANLEAQINAWNIDNHILLPQADGNFLIEKGKHVITIQWQSSENTQFKNKAQLIIPATYMSE